MGMRVIEGAGRYTPATGGEPNHWAEHLASADLSVGTYSIPAGGLDDQEPHREDEIYVVQAGAATLVTGSGTAQVQAGLGDLRASRRTAPVHRRPRGPGAAGHLRPAVRVALGCRERGGGCVILMSGGSAPPGQGG